MGPWSLQGGNPPPLSHWAQYNPEALLLSAICPVWLLGLPGSAGLLSCTDTPSGPSSAFWCCNCCYGTQHGSQALTTTARGKFILCGCIDNAIVLLRDLNPLVFCWTFKIFLQTWRVPQVCLASMWLQSADLGIHRWEPHIAYQHFSIQVSIPAGNFLPAFPVYLPC